MSKLDEIIKACQETPLEKTASETKTEQNLSDGIVSLLSKQANTNTLNRDDLDQMRKEAQDAGVALAHEILKQANLVNPTMESLAAEQDAADLDNAQGTVNQIKEELIRRSLRDNAMYPNAEVEDMLEGKTEADAEAASQVKAAAINELVAQGLDFDTATDLVKQAVAPVYTSGQHQDATLASLRASAPKYPSLDKDVPVDPLVTKITGNKTYKYGPSKGKTGPKWGPLTIKDKALAATSDSVKFVRKNKLPIGAGLGSVALAGGAAYAYKKHQEKTAFVNDLVSQGYDFDMAVDMVKQASYSGFKWDPIEIQRKITPPLVIKTEEAVDTPLTLKERAKKIGKGVVDSTPVQYMAGQGKNLAENAKRLAMGGEGGRMAGLSGLGKNHLVRGAAGLGALGAAKVGYDKYKEKTAFVNDLVSQGYDFDMAVDMVKQASYEADLELQAMSSGFDKVAAVSDLVKEGHSFEDASDLVKLASEQHEAELYKAAAIEEFVNQGLDYDLSVALVKEAAEGRDDLYQELLASMSE